MRFIFIILLTTVLFIAGCNQHDKKPAVYMSIQGNSNSLILPLNTETVKTASVDEDGEMKFIKVQLTDLAGEKLNSLSGENIGHTLNMVWENKIISSATINSALGARFSIYLGDSYTREDLKQIISAISQD